MGQTTTTDQQATGEATQQTQEQQVQSSQDRMEQMNKFMALFSLVIGAYAVYAGIRGKGYAYKNDYPAQIAEEANKLLRIFLLILGPIMLVFSALEYFEIWPESYLISIIAVLIGVIVYVVIFRVKFGKALMDPKKVQKKKQEALIKQRQAEKKAANKDKK